MVVRVPDSLSSGTILENTAVQWHPSPWLSPQPSNQELQKHLQYWSMTQGTQRKRAPSEAARRRPWSSYLSEGYSQGAARTGLPHEGGQVSSQGWPQHRLCLHQQGTIPQGLSTAGRARGCSRDHQQHPTRVKNQGQGPPGDASQEQKKTELETGLETSCDIWLRGPSRMQANSRGGPRSIGDAVLETGTPQHSSGQELVPIPDLTASHWAEVVRWSVRVRQVGAIKAYQCPQGTDSYLTRP